MLGFAAGFPYLIGMHASLAMPRHATPRIEVGSGSVGIAGAQTGIYPRKGPGGWQIIGRTEVATWDLERDPAALLRPGVTVVFEAVTS
jgi:inhibitor of KinA